MHVFGERESRTSDGCNKGKRIAKIYWQSSRDNLLAHNFFSGRRRRHRHPHSDFAHLLQVKVGAAVSFSFILQISLGGWLDRRTGREEVAEEESGGKSNFVNPTAKVITE